MMMIEDIPEGYTHKATSESLLRTESVCIYYSNWQEDYLIVIDSETSEPSELYLTKSQLALLVQSATDTLEMDTR
jgi:hypothetical protein